MTVGTVFERSKIPLNKWLLASTFYAASKKGMSAHQLHRMLGVTYKTAWFMAHRIREAMKEDVKSTGPLGGEGKTVEADETYIGKRETRFSSRRSARVVPDKCGKAAALRSVSLLGWSSAAATPACSMSSTRPRTTVRDILVRNADRKSTLYTDESSLYTTTGKEFASHRTVKHTLANTPAMKVDCAMVHTNTIENVFSVFKRGMLGVYQHCGEAHLHRYLAEFDFRYNRRTALGVDDRERHDRSARMASTASALPIGGLVKPARLSRRRAFSCARRGCKSREIVETGLAQRVGHSSCKTAVIRAEPLPSDAT